MDIVQRQRAQNEKRSGHSCPALGPSQDRETGGVASSRTLKKPASFVGAPIAVFSCCNGSHAKRLNPEGVSPFAKIHPMGERFTRSAVWISSPPHSLRPRPWIGASRAIDCGAIGGWAGEINAELGG